MTAPDSGTYHIQWGSGPLSRTEQGRIEPELGYRDHHADPRGMDPFGNFDVTVYAGDGKTYPYGEPGKKVEAILFVSGEYATCKHEEKTIRLNWTRQEAGLNPFDAQRKQVSCGSYR